LLELGYPVDKFFLAARKGETEILRDEASNTFEAMPQARRPKRLLHLPKRARVHVAVHRYDNALFYKRLWPEAFGILQNLDRGMTVERSCSAALLQTKKSNVDWAAKIKEWFNDWSSLGWFYREQK
jgi:hypothetical protein